MINSPRFEEAVDAFNGGAFFSAHELWEELWHETDGEEKEFLQALIQAAVACHHARKGNLKGARDLWLNARKRLQPFRPSRDDIDVERLVREMSAVFAVLEPLSRAQLPGAVNDSEKPVPPGWRFQPPSLRVSP